MSLYGGIELTGKPDLENVRRLDLLPMKSIGEMMRIGMAIDVDKLDSITEQLTAEIHDLRADICSEIPADKLDEFIERSNMDAEDDYLPMNVESVKQMRRLLFEVLKVGDGHDLRLTKMGDISTGKRQLEARKGDHPIVQMVLDYRERAKLKNTYSAKLPLMAVTHPKGDDCPVCGLKHFGTTKRIHCEIMTTRTSTGRPATKKPNLQNIPVRSDWGRKIRSGFVASPGMEMVAVDFSQGELRLLGHCGNVKRMIKVFEEKGDIHLATAMEAFNETDPKKIDKLTQRAPAKNVNFAVVYGETPQGLFDQLVSDTYGKSGIPVPDWLTLEWCEDFMRKWFGIYPEVQDYMSQEHHRAYRYGMVWTLMGRIRYVPEVHSQHKRIVSAGLRQAGNMKIQGSLADLLKLAQTEIQDTVIEEIRRQDVFCWPLNEVHDELIIEVEEGWGDIVLGNCEDVMRNVLVDKDTGEDLCRVPIEAEGKVMKEWIK